MRKETNRIEFNLKEIANLPVPKSGRVHHYAEDTDGLGVRVEPTGKSFFWWRKVNGTAKFISLGDFPPPTITVNDPKGVKVQAQSIASAKGEAQKLNSQLTRLKLDKWVWRQEGDNPFEKKIAKPRASVPTFRELVEAYIAQRLYSSDEKERANNPPRAEYMVRWYVKNYFSDLLDRPLNSITVEDILQIKRACGKKQYLANRVIEFARAIFNWSAESKDGVRFYLCANPAKDVATFGEESRTRYLQPAEVVRFNEALANEPNADLRDFLILSMNTGARKGDVLSMRWQDVSIETARWVVPFPKGGKSYNVDLRAAALKVLERRESEAVKGAIFVFPSTSACGYLTDVKKPWASFRKRAQIPDVHVHDLRRTVGSYAAIGGASLQQIGAMLGHQSMQSTLVYARLCDTATREAREVGQRKMLSMMRAAKKRTKKLAAPRRRLLEASNV
jgi:integrase